MIDIHSHIIFDVDDGCNTLEESVTLFRAAEKNHVTNIILTPHYVDEESYDEAKVLKNFKALKKQLKKEKINISICLGNEVMVSSNLKNLTNIKSKTLNNSKYLLIEFSLIHDVDYIEDAIYELNLKNIIPIIAHPERCAHFQKNYENIKKYTNNRVLYQCNVESFFGLYGNKAKKIVSKMLKNHLISFISTDIHHANKIIYNDIVELKKSIEKKYGFEYANDLFINNANKVINNQNVGGNN